MMQGTKKLPGRGPAILVATTRISRYRIKLLKIFHNRIQSLDAADLPIRVRPLHISDEAKSENVGFFAGVAESPRSMPPRAIGLEQPERRKRRAGARADCHHRDDSRSAKDTAIASRGIRAANEAGPRQCGPQLRHVICTNHHPTPDMRGRRYCCLMGGLVLMTSCGFALLGLASLCMGDPRGKIVEDVARKKEGSRGGLVRFIHAITIV
jgi:hypothetical protein